jgi:multidrug efflux pump subunit AcrA (membrane-fusion protein)
MATSSQVKAGLDDIATSIRAERQALINAKARVSTAKANLNNLPTQFADVIATINAYTPTGAFEQVAKAELTELTDEFQDLKTKATTAETDLDAIDFTVEG